VLHVESTHDLLASVYSIDPEVTLIDLAPMRWSGCSSSAAS
jgi:hypothetical protein